MGNDLTRAREALAAGETDTALVLLWKAVEPARLADDEETLLEIAALARSIPGREAEDLVEATGASPSPAEPPGPAPEGAPPPRSALSRALWALVIVVLIALIGLAYVRGGSEITKLNPVQTGARVPIDADGLYLVPLARYPQTELTDVGISVIQRVGAVDIRSPIGLGPGAYDAERGQFVAEEILGRLTESYSIAEGRRALIVGVTSLEMYSRAEDASPDTSVARTGDGRYVVVSTHGFGDDPKARDARLRDVLLAEIARADLKPTL